MIPRLHIAAFALPVAFALAVLAATAANRSEGRGPTVLTDRDVLGGIRSDDKSIAEIFLGWSEPAGVPGVWIKPETLRSLGFDLSVDPSAPEAPIRYRRPLSRRAFVAFEIDGPAWQGVVAERGNPTPGAGAAPFGGGARLDGPRVVPVDIDLDAGALAARYPNPQTHLIAAAVIGARRFEYPGRGPYIGGVIMNLDPRRIQVSSDLASNLPMRRITDSQAFAYSVSLMYGRRWEPWVAEVSRGDPSR